jgi:hypothetical protein
MTKFFLIPVRILETNTQDYILSPKPTAHTTAILKTNLNAGRQTSSRHIAANVLNKQTLIKTTTW